MLAKFVAAKPKTCQNLPKCSQTLQQQKLGNAKSLHEFAGWGACARREVGAGLDLEVELAAGLALEVREEPRDLGGGRRAAWRGIGQT